MNKYDIEREKYRFFQIYGYLPDEEELKQWVNYVPNTKKDIH